MSTKANSFSQHPKELGGSSYRDEHTPLQQQSQPNVRYRNTHHQIMRFRECHQPTLRGPWPPEGERRTPTRHTSCSREQAATPPEKMSLPDVCRSDLRVY